MTYRIIKQKSETGRCLLCHDAPCTKACPVNVPVSDIIRSLRFENIRGAEVQKLKNPACFSCESPVCMAACIRVRIDAPVDIPAIIETVDNAWDIRREQVDLSVDFCGVHCENPFFLSSSVVASNFEMVAKAFEMGWAGVAFKTIGTFVPEEVSPRFDTPDSVGTSIPGFKNIEQISDHTLEENVEFISRLKKQYPTKVIIASIMGQDEEEWTYLADKMEEAGADILECNFSCPHMSREGLGSDVGSDPELVSLYTKAARRGTNLPILAKMTPNITQMEIPALAAVRAGADGLAAINTIKSVMSINLDTFASGPDVMGKSSVGGYSGKAVKPIALRFIHDLKTHKDLKNTAVSGMGGIETWRDAAEFITLGCATVQVTTAVMLYGYRLIDDLTDGLSHYLTDHGYTCVSEMVGKAIPNLIPADKLDRHTIAYPFFDRTRCVACKRCYLSCYDGGHQAITFDSEGKPVLNVKKCVGCQLCRLVCPAGAISSGKRIRIQQEI